MENDCIKPDKESEFQSLLRDLFQAVKTALSQEKQERTELLLIPDAPSDEKYDRELRSSFATQELLYWRAVCLGNWLAKDIAIWAETWQHCPSPYFNYNAVWVDVPALYRGEAPRHVVDWIRSLDRDELWSLVLANQMLWIFNQMDPIEAYPVIDGDLRGSAGDYLTKDTRSLSEWQGLLSPDTKPAVDLSGSFACMCWNANTIIESLLAGTPALQGSSGADLDLSQNLQKLKDIENTVHAIHEAQLPMHDVLEGRLRVIESRLRPTSAELRARLAKRLGEETLNMLTKAAQDNLLAAFQHLEDNELANGAAIIWGISAALESELWHCIYNKRGFRDVLFAATGERRSPRLGWLERVLQSPQVARFVNALRIDSTALGQALGEEFVRRRNSAVHGGPCGLKEGKDFWDKIVEGCRVFDILHGRSHR